MTEQSSIDVQAFKQFERDGYSSVAEGYEKITAQVTSQANEAVLNAVGTGAETKLLDVACGPGRLSARALERGANVIGLDFAPNMLGLARARCPNAEFHEGDAEHLPFDDSEFDAVVCSLGILHFPNPDYAIAEAFRVLKPGGNYAFTCWTPPAQNPFMGLILGSIQAHGTMDVDLPEGPPLFRFGEPAECESALRAAGFDSIVTTEVPMTWHADTPEDLVRQLPASTARLGPMLAQQSDEQRKRIEDAITEGARKYLTGDRIEIPTAVLLSQARKP